MTPHAATQHINASTASPNSDAPGTGTAGHEATPKTASPKRAWPNSAEHAAMAMLAKDAKMTTAIVNKILIISFMHSTQAHPNQHGEYNR